jgi:dihydroorotate dehydrogenase (fumarate)
VAVKLSAFYTSVPNLVARLDVAQADGFVLFNRYCLPDLDLETGRLVPGLPLSDPTELPQRLHAVALLDGKIHGSIAVSGGVSGATDVLKAVAVGAHAVQAVSALYRHGPEWLGKVREAISAWLDDHGVASLAEYRGRHSLARCPDPHAWQRGEYRRVLRGGVA